MCVYLGLKGMGPGRRKTPATTVSLLNATSDSLPAHDSSQSCWFICYQLDFDRPKSFWDLSSKGYKRIPCPVVEVDQKSIRRHAWRDTPVNSVTWGAEAECLRVQAQVGLHSEALSLYKSKKGLSSRQKSLEEGSLMVTVESLSVWGRLEFLK